MKHLKTGILICVVAGLLTACGGGGESAQSASPGKPAEVNIGTQQLPNDEMIAIIKGYYEEEMGVKVNILNFEAGDIRNAMMAGDIDFAMLGSSSAILGKANGMDVSLIWVHEIIGTSEQLVAHNDSDIYTIEDVRGKTLAAPFTSTAHYSLLKALDHYGIKETELTLLDMQQPDIIAAWDQGNIDAAYGWEPGVSRYLENGRSVITSEQLAAEGILTANVEMVRNEFAAQYPEMVKAYIRAVNRANADFQADPDAAAELIGDYIGISKEEAMVQMKGSIWLSLEDQVKPEYMGTTDAIGAYADSVIDTADFLYDQQSLTEKPDHDRMRAFVDPTFVQAVLDES